MIMSEISEIKHAADLVLFLKWSLSVPMLSTDKTFIQCFRDSCKRSIIIGSEQNQHDALKPNHRMVKATTNGAQSR